MYNTDRRGGRWNHRSRQHEATAQKLHTEMIQRGYVDIWEPVDRRLLLII